MEVLYKSILTLAPNAKLNKNIIFHMEPMPLILTEDNIINIIGCLSIQIENLTKLGYGIIGIDFEDLIQIRDKVFFINPNKLYKLNQDKYMTLTKPIKQPQYSSEIPKELPAKIYYTASYYSLGKLVEEMAVYVPDNSKLFHFIRRTKKDEKKRQLLFI